jgi:hypothetical protein
MKVGLLRIPTGTWDQWYVVTMPLRTGCYKSVCSAKGENSSKPEAMIEPSTYTVRKMLARMRHFV